MHESVFAHDDHLPKKRGDRPLIETQDLPRQRRGTVPGGHSRYPDQDVMAEQDDWDAVTRRMLVDRVENPPPIRFLDAGEEACLRAFVDLFLGQDDEDPRVPALEWIDDRLYTNRSDGYRHVDLPPSRELWRLVVRALDEAARARGAPSYAEAEGLTREWIVGALADARLEAPSLEGLSQKTVWSVLTGQMVEAFWSHPWAWNEMGFPGPAYPRGYARLGADEREYWEAYEEGPVRDRRAP
jgi:hypothetical protein